MAEIVKTVKIETGNGERSVKSLKKEISDLRDALLNMEQGGEEWVKTAHELTQAQEDLNAVMKAGKQAIDADSTSIAGMEARYKSLYQTYRLLSQEQRKSAEGISMQKELAELSKNLNNVKKDAGNFKDNIGHYAEDMMSAFSSLGISIGGLNVPFKLASQGAGGFKKALDVLAKHPILTALVILIGLFKKVGDAIKENEELQMRMNKVMAAFKPIGDAVAIILDKIATLAVKVAEGMAKIVTWVTNLIGLTAKLSDAELALADAENNLIKNRREIELLNSSDEARIQELMEEAQLTEDKAEKEKMLLEAKQLQEQVNKRNIELAEEELRIIKEKNKLTPNSTADLEAENQAQIKVNEARENGARALRRINRQVLSAQKDSSAGHNKELDELNKILERVKKNSQTEVQELTEKYEKEKKLLEKYHKDTTELTKEYNKNLEKIETQRYINISTARLNYYNNMAAAFVQPSNSAFNYLKEGALKMEGQFIDIMEAEFGKRDHKTLLETIIGDPKNINKFINEGELTSLAEKLNAIFNAGITKYDNLDTIKDKIESLSLTLSKNTTEIAKAYKEWDNETWQLEVEIKNLKEQFEFDPEGTLLDPKNVGDNAETYMAELKNKLDKEREMLENRVKFAEIAFREVKGLDEEALNAKGITLNEQLELEKAYYEAMQELRDKDTQARMEAAQAHLELNENLQASIFELGEAHRQSISTIAETYKTLIEAYKRDGKISDQEAKKKAKTLQWLEGIQGAVAVASIVADTASAWMSVNKSLAAEYVLNAETAAATGPAAAATKAALDMKSTVVAGIRKASIIVNGAAAAAAAVGKTIASIKGLSDDMNESGGAGATAAPQLIDSTPYSYTRQLQTDVEREEMLNTPIYVRVTDIDTAQERSRTREAEVTF